jgi:hypothetical protein
MLGGPDGGEAARLSAADLLERANAWRAVRMPDPGT